MNSAANKTTARQAAIDLCVEALSYTRGKRPQDDDGQGVELICVAYYGALDNGFKDVAERFRIAVARDTLYSAPAAS